MDGFARNADNFEKRLMRALRVARREWLQWEEASSAEFGFCRRKLRLASRDSVSLAVREAERKWLRHKRRIVAQRYKKFVDTRAEKQRDRKRETFEGAIIAGAVSSERLLGSHITSALFGNGNGRKHSEGYPVAKNGLRTRTRRCGKASINYTGVDSTAESTDKIAARLGTMHVSEQEWCKENDPGAWLVG